jgi:hypothetical protein
MDKKQLRQYKSAFHFGVSVSYNFILKRGYGEHTDGGWSHTTEKIWKQKIVPKRIGVVVGWRWITNGIAKFDSGEGNSYKSTQSIFAIEVKRGMMNKVDLVLPESLTLRDNPYNLAVGGHLAIPHHQISTMSDKDKACLRDVMKDVPRDSKGRWK